MSLTFKMAMEKLPSKLTERQPDHLSIFQSWLIARGAGAQEDHCDSFLDAFTLESLIETLQSYEKRLAAEALAGHRGEAEKLPIEDIDSFLLKSERLAPYIKQRQEQGIKAAAALKILGDQDFQRAYLEDNWEAFLAGRIVLTFLKETKEKGASEEALKAFLNFRIGQRIDSMDGFTSQASDRTIHLRKGEVTVHAMIHEAIHRYAGENFFKSFGKAINEGATEIFARRVMLDTDLRDQIGNHYPDWTDMVLDLMDLEIFDRDSLKNTYFKDEGIDVIVESIKKSGAKIEAKIGEKPYRDILQEIGIS